MTRRIVATMGLLALTACVSLDAAQPGAPPASPGPIADDQDPAAGDPAAGDPAAGVADPAGAPQPPAPDPLRLPAARACGNPAACSSSPERVGAFDVAAVPEASGLAASRRNPGRYYLVDDEPGTDRVWVSGADGALQGSLQVSGLDAVNAEDLAVGACGPGDPATCVYVGDVGDNVGGRETIRVHRFVEPDLGSGAVAGTVGADSVALRYPGGARPDAESLLVDGDGVPHVVTKATYDRDTGETGATHLYRAPGYADGTMELVGEVPVPASGGLMASIVGDVVTAADSVPGRVLLRTYDGVLSFDAPTPDAPLALFPSWPMTEVPAALQRQSEAVALEPDGCGYRTVAEGSGDVWAVACGE